MKVYSLSQAAVKKLRRRLLQRLLIGFSLASITVMTLNLWNAGHDWIWTLLMYIISIPISVGLIISWSLNQAEERWRTIRIELGDDYVARPFGDATLRIDRNEVISIDEIKGELYVRTGDNFPTLIIKIKRTLFSWIPQHQ